MNNLSRFMILVVVAISPSVAFADSVWDCSNSLSDNSAACRALIGKRLWIAVPNTHKHMAISICPIPNPREYSRCKTHITGSFVVNSVTPNPTLGHDLAVTFQDGTSGFVHAWDMIFVKTFDPIAAAHRSQEECIRRGQPKIGMTINEATATCWGKPRRVVKTTTAAGVQHDFIYGGGHILRFENEKLSAILETAGR